MMATENAEDEAAVEGSGTEVERLGNTVKQLVAGLQNVVSEVSGLASVEKIEAEERGEKETSKDNSAEEDRRDGGAPELSKDTHLK